MVPEIRATRVRVFGSADFCAVGPHKIAHGDIPARAHGASKQKSSAQSLFVSC